MNINEFVERSVKQNASDLHFCVGHLPVMRITGDLHFCMTCSPVSQQWMETLCQQLLNDTQRCSLQQHHHIDFACQLPGNTRLRGHFFYQQRGLSLTFRLLPANCPTLESLHIPAIISNADDAEKRPDSGQWPHRQW